MEQALKTFTQQMNTQNSPFGNAAFSPGSTFPFPPSTNPFTPSTSPFTPSTNPSDSYRTSTPLASQPVTVDVPATEVEDHPSVSVKDKVVPEDGPKKYGISQALFVPNMPYLFS